MTASGTPLVLPPDVYDALELSALAFDGIGFGRVGADFGDWSNVVVGISEPCCVRGHALWLDRADDGEVSDALTDASIGERENDRVVPPNTRIPFDEWCRRLNVVRGDEPTFDPANFGEGR